MLLLLFLLLLRYHFHQPLLSINFLILLLSIMNILYQMVSPNYPWILLVPVVEQVVKVGMVKLVDRVVMVCGHSCARTAALR